MKDDRSPLKDRPLRLPGQSLSEERTKLWDEKLEPWLLLALFMVALAVMEWFRHFTQSPPTPLLFSAVAACFVVFASWRLWRARPKLKQLRQGIEGERAVGEFLGGLRPRGYRVFHDLIGPRFNLDHVLVGPAGVFTIETKTWSKPVRGDARVVFDGQTLKAGDHVPDRDPVTQARAGCVAEEPHHGKHGSYCGSLSGGRLSRVVRRTEPHRVSRRQVGLSQTGLVN